MAFPRIQVGVILEVLIRKKNAQKWLQKSEGEKKKLGEALKLISDNI